MLNMYIYYISPTKRIFWLLIAFWQMLVLYCGLGICSYSYRISVHLCRICAILVSRHN